MHSFSLITEARPKAVRQSKRNAHAYNVGISTYYFPVLLKNWSFSVKGKS